MLYKAKYNLNQRIIITTTPENCFLVIGKSVICIYSLAGLHKEQNTILEKILVRFIMRES